MTAGEGAFLTEAASPGWSRDDVAGHACNNNVPMQPSEHGFVVLYLHGIHCQHLHKSAAYTKLFERHGLRVIAPHGARSWWTDKICAEFDANLTAERHIRTNVVGWLAEHWDAQPPRIGLLGTSMGGQGALRLAFKYPNTFPVVAALAPAIDYQIRFEQTDEETLPLMYADAEAARQDTATLHVHPLNWPRNTWYACDPADDKWHESSERLRMKMSALGIPFEYDLETSAGGHTWQYYDHMAPTAVGFIVDRLERERRRV